MSLVDHARFELKQAGLLSTDADYDGWVAQEVIDLIARFAGQGHSGGSAGQVVQLFDRLSRYLPLTPLTGDDHEWIEVAEAGGLPLYQNRRYYSVFKRGFTGHAYDCSAYSFEDADGTRWTTNESHVHINFPYMPKTEVVMRYSPFSMVWFRLRRWWRNYWVTGSFRGDR